MAWGIPAFITVVPMNQSSIGEERLIAADGNQVPAGIGTGQFDSGGGDVGAIFGEFHHVRTVDNLEHRFGKVDFDVGGAAKVGAELHLLVGRFNDRIKCVSQGDGAQVPSRTR